MSRNVSKIPNAHIEKQLAKNLILEASPIAKESCLDYER